MQWANVYLIFRRELRDQLRDRRTMFTIAVLPILLYPLLGLALMQAMQFLQQHPVRVRVVGAESLPAEPSLIADGRWAEGLLGGEDAKLLELEIVPAPADGAVPTPDEVRSAAEAAVRRGETDLVLYFPPEFAAELARAREGANSASPAPAADAPLPAAPEPILFVDAARDSSRVARERVYDVLQRWKGRVVEQNLAAYEAPPAAIAPFEVVDADVAEDGRRRALMWSKILPFVVVIWALTGAFYPAIDLCAGEKERGTLETLLCSPAQRSEIVCGKLLTITAFSIATAVLNLASLGLTGLLVMGRLAAAGPLGIGPPPLLAMAWLLVGLVPISALFSALALAVAALARSSKEGQYYLMPLLLGVLPLMMLSMLPAAELNLGMSLIPVTGMMLLLRSLMEGQYREALLYFPPVAGVTGVGCFLAVRWAVSQFQNEAVLFREGERWRLDWWLRGLVRDRDDTPTVAEALFCGVLLLVIRFFASLAAEMPEGWGGVAATALISQLALIAAPALLMTLLLTRSPRATLSLRLPPWQSLPAAAMLAVLLHPLAIWLGRLIQQLYPISPDTLASLRPFEEAIREAPLWVVLATLALAPAICEELAFRGFILSGMRRLGNKWAALGVTAVLFGVAHGVLQQSLAACVVGIVLGYLCVQTGSLLPGVVFHFTHNALALLTARASLAGETWLDFVFQESADGGAAFRWPLTAIGAALSFLILLYFRNLTAPCSSEERLQELRERHAAQAAAKT